MSQEVQQVLIGTIVATLWMIGVCLAGMWLLDKWLDRRIDAAWDALEAECGRLDTIETRLQSQLADIKQRLATYWIVENAVFRAGKPISEEELALALEGVVDRSTLRAILAQESLGENAIYKRFVSGTAEMMTISYGLTELGHQQLAAWRRKHEPTSGESFLRC